VNEIDAAMTDLVWRIVEEMYLESDTEQEQAEYVGMTTREKWGVLEPFLLSRSKTGHADRWMKLVIERLSAKAARGGGIE
jgi:hypothetical protein